MKNRLLLVVMVLCVVTAGLYAKPQWKQVNRVWQQTMLAAIDSFPEHGGYYTGGKPTADFPTTAWRGLHESYVMIADDERPYVDCHKAQP